MNGWWEVIEKKCHEINKMSFPFIKQEMRKSATNIDYILKSVELKRNPRIPSLLVVV
jgi:hypothetical protein